MTSTYDRKLLDQRIEARQSNICQLKDGYLCFEDTLNVFRLFVAQPYGSNVYFANFREALDQLAAHYEIGYSGVDEAAGMVLTDGFGTIILGVFDGSTTTLVHEAGHAAFQVLHRAGVKISVDNDEAFCYMLDNIFSAFEHYI